MSISDHPDSTNSPSASFSVCFHRDSEAGPIDRRDNETHEGGQEPKHEEGLERRARVVYSTA